MEEILKSILPSLGAFGPAALLGWWVIKTQQGIIAAKDARIENLTNQVIALGTTTATVITELKNAIKS